MYYVFDRLCTVSLIIYSFITQKFWDLVIHALNMMCDNISTIMVSMLFICRLLTDSVRQSQDRWAGSRDWSEVEVPFH